MGIGNNGLMRGNDVDVFELSLSDYLAPGTIIMICKLDRLHSLRHSTQPQPSCPGHPPPPPPPPSKILHLAQPISWLHKPWVKRLARPQRRRSERGRNITQKPQLQPSNMKSLFLFLTNVPCLIAGSTRWINKQGGHAMQKQPEAAVGW